uniref:Lipoprotein n=1 Tax=Streptomyces sp. NBC_00049 TaxID=2903617 RepID=A0AAU2K2X2_9ACTN
MPVSGRPARVLSAVAVAAVVLAGSAGCAEKDGGTPAAASSLASASPSPSASASASATVPASPSGTPTAAGSSVPAASPTARSATPAPPAAPTRLTVAVDTRGGRLGLVRGGAAQEFTVTLRNGNSAEYRHLLVAFQMEILVGEPGDRPGSGPGFVLERLDKASGSWRPAEFRIANDAKPASLFTGGGALARDAVRVERYRMRATAGGPTGSSPVVVSFIDTDADRAVAAHIVLGHSTR